MALPAKITAKQKKQSSQSEVTVLKVGKKQSSAGQKSGNSGSFGSKQVNHHKLTVAVQSKAKAKAKEKESARVKKALKRTNTQSSHEEIASPDFGGNIKVNKRRGSDRSSPQTTGPALSKGPKPKL